MSDSEMTELWWTIVEVSKNDCFKDAEADSDLEKHKSIISTIKERSASFNPFTRLLQVALMQRNRPR